MSAARSGMSITFSCDAIGRRLLKQVTAGDSTTTAQAFLSVGEQEFAEFSGVGTVYVDRVYAFGPGLDEPVLDINAVSGVRSYYFEDALGSVIALTNGSGVVSEKHAYTPYDVGVSAAGSTAAYRFAGRRFDPETGLYHNRARAYSPTLGRFLQADPIGTDGGINLYAYVNNDPLNMVDPKGEAGTIVSTALDFTPVVGDIKGFYDAYQDPTWTNIAAAGIGVFGPIGDGLAKGLKTADKIGIGQFAAESIPARSPARDFTAAERNEINSIGSTAGCHTCGSTSPGTLSGNFVPDHQPPPHSTRLAIRNASIPIAFRAVENKGSLSLKRDADNDMPKSVQLRPPNSLVLIEDFQGGELPSTMMGRLVASTSTCISVGCLSEFDGEAEIVLAMGCEIESPAQLVFDGVIEVPSKKVTVRTVLGDSIAEQNVQSPEVRVYVWANDPNEPDKIWIGLDAL